MTVCEKCNAKCDTQESFVYYKVCPQCGFHFSLSPQERIAMTVDEGTFQEFNADMTSKNPIDLQGYDEKLELARSKANLNEAVVTGHAHIDGNPAVLAIMAFQFMGGSMGSVVGEKIARAMMEGIKKKAPVIIFTASGGARMQEGIFSLMQMAKTSSVAALMEEDKVPLFLVLCNPTTGGVTASFAMLGDVTLAEPGAIIGFAGRRVIEGTIRQKLPADFQTAEFQQARGFIDLIVARPGLKHALSFLIKTHKGGKNG